MYTMLVFLNESFPFTFFFTHLVKVFVTIPIKNIICVLKIVAILVSEKYKNITSCNYAMWLNIFLFSDLILVLLFCDFYFLPY